MLKKSTRIIHIADIHWRGGTSRHAEYRESFEDFFKQASDLKPDIIVVGGDIVHSKTQGISPELIDCLTWWFNGLANINPEARVVMIPGNHDGILHNKDRQDAISPILTAMNHPRIDYFKNSGVYKSHIPGISWCVFSCFDEEGWHSVSPADGDLNIALFHGSVKGCLLDNDMEMTEGEVDVDFFKRFDLTLLGDIHTKQFLTTNKRIGYSGSSIQQNYGESRNKGFLVWDVSSKDDFTVDFHRIKHTKPFVTIDWAGSVQETLKSAKPFSKGARFRIKSTETIPQSEISQIRNELGVTKLASEVVFKISTEVDVNSINTDTVSAFKEDLYDVATHMRLLKEYFKSDQFSSDEWVEIESLVKHYIQTITGGETVPRSTKWTLRRMRFDNTFGYGKDNVINFDNLPGITGIFGKNASGKSSIVGTIVYSLFNATDRGTMKNLHVINSRKGHCLTSADFSVNNEHFRMERQSVRHENKRGDQNAITHLNLYSIDDEGTVLADLSEEQRKDTEKILRERIGTADDFLLTSLCAQGEMNTFIKEKATARKTVLTRFLGLDIFEKMYRIAKDELNSLKVLVNKAPERDWASLIDEKRRRIKTLQDAIQMWERILIEKRLLVQEKQVSLGTMKSADLITQSDVDRQKISVDALKKKLLDQITLRDQTTKKITDIEAETTAITESLSKISIDEIRERFSAQRDLESSILQIKNTLDKESHTLSIQERSVKILSSVPCEKVEGDFSACRFIKDSHKNRALIEDQRNLVSDLTDRISATERSIEIIKRDELQKTISSHESLTKKLSDLMIRISEQRVTESSLDHRASVLKDQILSAEGILAEMRSRVSAIDNESEIETIKAEIFALSAEISTLDGKRLSAAGDTGKLESEIGRLQEERGEYDKLRARWRIFESLSEALSHRGIPFQIISNQLPVINQEIAKVLHGIVDFSVVMESDDESNAMDVYIDYGDSRRIMELGSGMEKMIASLAIRIALINVSSLPKSDMLIIDEGFGALDDTYVEACARLLESLKQWFKSILIITHVEAVKDAADNVIEIVKNGKDSWVHCE